MLNIAMSWGDLDWVDLESRRGRGVVRVRKEGVAWHVERAERDVQFGVDRNDGVRLRTARRSGGRSSSVVCRRVLLNVSLHVEVVEFAAHKMLRIEDGTVRVHRNLIHRSIADKQLGAM